MIEIKSLYRLWIQYNKEISWCKDSNIKVFNFWNLQKPADLWFYQFIQHHFGERLSKKNSIALFSVMGDRRKIRLNRSKVKVFFTGENTTIWKDYKDHCIHEVDLSMGFEFIHVDNYLRFPLWLLYILDPRSDYQAVKNSVHKISRINDERQSYPKRFCSLVCRHDGNGIRTEMFNLLSPVGQIDSAGPFLNNTNELRELYNNQKQEYIKNYKFNICPENSNTAGYVTEKLFESISAGCIPLYWGNENPEPEVLNKNAILFYKGAEHSHELTTHVRELHYNEKLYREFISQETFVPTAAEYIWDRLNMLKEHLNRLLKT